MYGTCELVIATFQNSNQYANFKLNVHFQENEMIEEQTTITFQPLNLLVTDYPRRSSL